MPFGGWARETTIFGEPTTHGCHRLAVLPEFKHFLRVVGSIPNNLFKFFQFFSKLYTISRKPLSKFSPILFSPMSYYK